MRRGKHDVVVALWLLVAGCAPGSDDPDSDDDVARATGADTVEHATIAAREGYLVGAGAARIRYRVVGDAPDTVVVVHGGPGAGMNSVRPDFEPLADALTLVFYDQRGGGRSELPADTSLLHARFFVEDLDSVRAHFGFERMNLMTHSFGSVLVASYSREHPERIRAIVLHGATGPVRERAAQLARRAPPSPDTTLSRRAGELLGSLLDGSAADAADGADAAEICRRWEAIGRRLAEARGEPERWSGTSCDAPPEAVAYYFRYTAQLAPRTFGDWDFTEGLDDVDAPVLVVYTDQDSLEVAEQRAWADAFPRGRLLLVPGDGKGAISERPKVVRPAIVGWFRRQGS